jgi:hypothetical protein
MGARVWPGGWRAGLSVSVTQGAAKIVYTVPAGPPMCAGTRADGREYAIYGTPAAEQACPH